MAFSGFFGNEIDVIGAVKQRQLINRGATRWRVLNCVAERRSREFFMEDRMTIRAERVIVTEPVAGQCLTFINEDRRCTFFGHLGSGPLPGFARSAAYLIIGTIMRASFS